jgi:hypothetical protein
MVTVKISYIKIVKSHNFDNLKYLCNQSTDFDETAIKLLRKFFFITLAIQYKSFKNSIIKILIFKGFLNDRLHNRDILLSP